MAIRIATCAWGDSFATCCAEAARAGYAGKEQLHISTAGGWTHTFGGGFIPSDAAVFLPDGTRKTGRDLELEYLLSLDEAGRERLFPHGVRRSVAQECHEFVDCIRLGRAPEVKPEEGLEGLAIAAAVYESAHCGQAVRVAEVRESCIDAYQRPVDLHWGLV